MQCRVLCARVCRCVPTPVTTESRAPDLSPETINTARAHLDRPGAAQLATSYSSTTSKFCTVTFTRPCRWMLPRVRHTRCSISMSTTQASMTSSRVERHATHEAGIQRCFTQSRQVIVRAPAVSLVWAVLRVPAAAGPPHGSARSPPLARACSGRRTLWTHAALCGATPA
jgi:hypothetical protein